MTDDGGFHCFVMPAKAGIQPPTVRPWSSGPYLGSRADGSRIKSGMTSEVEFTFVVMPAKAGIQP
ncbi:hypothetical protein AWR36_004830, partial [Microbulbifer flavimaris]